jgi:hypothetical protein
MWQDRDMKARLTHIAVALVGVQADVVLHPMGAVGPMGLKAMPPV